MSILGNPPVVEVFIALEFVPAPDGQPWNFGTAQEFALSIDSDWDEAKILTSREVQVAEMQQGLPQIVGEKHVIDRVQLFDKDRTSCIQFNRTAMIYNSLRSGTDYPGYEKIYKAAELKFKSFVEFFRPVNVREAVICYVDVINIPVGNKTSVELSDYFKMGVNLEEDVFGPMSHYEFRSAFDCKVDPGPLLLSIQSLPGRPGQDHLRLRMEWQKICVQFDKLDLAEIKRRLDTSKQHLSDCFRESFTPEGWQLFDPEDRIE